MMFRFMARVVALGAFGLLAADADAAGFTTFDGVDGGSSASGHRGWVDVESFSWGAHRPGANVQLRPSETVVK